MKRFGWMVGVAMAIHVASASAAPPPTDEQRATVYYDDAGRAYKDGHYDEAVTLLLKAYDLAPKPVILQNLGRAYERLGRSEDAIAAFKKYLSTEPFAKDEAAINTEIATLQKQVDEKHALEANAASANAQAALDAKAKKDADDRASAATLESKRLAEENRHHASPLPWVVFGVGVAGGINGAVFGALADARHRAAADPSVDQTAALKTQDQAKTFATVANVSFIAGGALALGGLIWGVVDLVITGKAKERVRVAPAMSVGWLGLQGTF